ncbi:ABC transporter ATPase [Nitzschia inconspicua]|uniref:ABC transporter ATPase n=1 Tax=Nitzschia inconspicua TaxID=303405 RepID=A0A9K3Q5J1_9STRA|nr:ABC transporter ATPase [Nitzschia inconspicua]
MRRIFCMFCWQTLLTASLCLAFQPPQRIRRTAVLERPSTRRITFQSQIHERVYSSALFALSTDSSSSSTTAQSSSSSPPVLTVENLSCTHNGGETYQLKDVSYNLHRGRKVALIGRNGTGKSTFLKILHESYLKGTWSSSSDQLTAYREETNYKYTGKVEIPKTVRVAMVDQEPPMPSDVTVGDAILGITKLNVSPSRNSNNDVMDVVRNYRFASRQAETDPDAFVRASAAMEKMAGSWDVLTRAEEIASKLKIHHLQDLPLSMLSGGERKRVALCAALVEEPDVLLLDEPSNYLSLAGIEWLSELLTSNSNPKLTVLMVTHDRAFLEEVCDSIVELDRGSLYEHQGSYSSFLQAKEDRLALEDAAVQAANAKLRVELEWMRRQPQARESKSKARIDAFYKLEQATKPRPRDPNLNLVETVGGKSRRIGTKIVSMKNVSLKFGDRVMLDDFSYDFCVGDRICLAGANGVGKTTFTKLITGEVEPDSGFIEIGDTVVLGVYDQLGLKFDPSAESQTVMEFVIDQAQYDNIMNTGDTPAEARQLLKQFEFPRSRWNEPISVLSGGERRRLQLLSVLTKKPNFLIADEPSVDLDLDTLSALETFLDQFQGVLLTVSHDRAFADKVTDHLFVFEGDGVVKDFGGTLSEYASCLVELENRKIQQASGDNSAAEIKRQKHKEDSAERNQVRNFVRGAKKEMLNIERALEKLRGKSNDIQAEIDGTSSDEGWSVLAELTDKLNSVNEQIEEKEIRWLELGEDVERLDSNDF